MNAFAKVLFIRIVYNVHTHTLYFIGAKICRERSERLVKLEEWTMWRIDAQLNSKDVSKTFVIL